MTQVDINDLLRMLGENQVEIRYLRDQLQQAMRLIPQAPSPVEEAIAAEAEPTPEAGSPDA